MVRLLFLLFGLLGIAANLPAQDKATYDTLLNQVKNLSSGEVIERGDTYLGTRHTETAIVLYSIVYGRFREGMSEEEKQNCATGYLKAGDVYYEQGSYTNALEMYINGLKISESCREKPDLMLFYKNIGNIYCIFGDYERGINYYETGYSFRKKHPNRKVECDLLSNLTGICCFIHETDKAKRYYEMAETMKQPGDTVKIYMSYYNWGLILASEKKYAQATEYFAKAAASIRSPKYRCFAYEQLYQKYELLNRQDSMLYYLGLCNEVAAKNGFTQLYVQTLKTYSDYYEGRDERMTHFYKSKYLSITDSLYNTREFYRIRNRQFLYELEKTGREITDLQVAQRVKEQKVRQQRRILSVIMGGLLLISALLVVVYRQKKRIQGSYRDLFEMNRNILISDSQSRALCKKYEQTIDELRSELGHYQEQQAEKTADADDRQEPDTTVLAKYQASKLNDDRKRMLLKSIREVMEQTHAFCREDFSLERLAELVHSNHKYVSQVINENCGKNFSDFINEYRIREARLRLMDAEHYGNYTIQAVAESVGYKSQSTFIRAFRKITGIPPSIYQKMAQEKGISFCDS